MLLDVFFLAINKNNKCLSNCPAQTVSGWISLEFILITCYSTLLFPLGVKISINRSH